MRRRPINAHVHATGAQFGGHWALSTGTGCWRGRIRRNAHSLAAVGADMSRRNAHSRGAVWAELSREQGDAWSASRLAHLCKRLQCGPCVSTAEQSTAMAIQHAPKV